ncbi:MAG: hypothetical protein HOV87_34925 [Catenulispora sp.]|nr:hypothetical protein [Catenulispora sp.]
MRLAKCARFATVNSVLSRPLTDVWHYVRDAPGTYIWLLALLVTTQWLARLSTDRRAKILAANSTNLVRLRQAPLKVLVTSIFYTTGTSWLFYLVTYTAFHAPTEHWLGTWRWLAVVAMAHIGATLVSQAYVAWEVRRGRLPETERETMDYGVSYAQAGAAAILTWRIPLPWRIPYLVAVAAFYIYGLARQRDFTALGHVCAVGIGLACSWLAP